LLRVLTVAFGLYLGLLVRSLLAHLLSVLCLHLTLLLDLWLLCPCLSRLCRQLQALRSLLLLLLLLLGLLLWLLLLLWGVSVLDTAGESNTPLLHSIE
jgi:hypothetical protein